MKIFWKLLLSSLVFLLQCNVVVAANITTKDCAIGGVAAGWHSSHHYLPEKFKDTALRDVEWVKSSFYVPLDNYPATETVAGFHHVSKERISRDKSISLYGALTKTSREHNLFNSIFNKEPIYIIAISVNDTNKMNRSYKLLATDMQTPRGIHLNSTLDELLQKYGHPDKIVNKKNGEKIYMYKTPESVNRNGNFEGAGMNFWVLNNEVVMITVYNSYGY